MATSNRICCSERVVNDIYFLIHLHVEGGNLLSGWLGISVELRVRTPETHAASLSSERAYDFDFDNMGWLKDVYVYVGNILEDK